MTINWEEGVELVAGPYVLGLTDPSPETAEYWRGIDRDQLMIKRCANCHEWLHPRRILCPECRSAKLSWWRAKGTGTIYSFSTLHRAPSQDHAPNVPYTNGIIELTEGIFLFGRIDAAELEIAIGRPVTVGFRKLVAGQRKLPVFSLSRDPAG